MVMVELLVTLGRSNGGRGNDRLFGGDGADTVKGRIGGQTQHLYSDQDP
jgi:Ca2+-binding RTX toxin-like protein